MVQKPLEHPAWWPGRSQEDELEILQRHLAPSESKSPDQIESLRMKLWHQDVHETWPRHLAPFVTTMIQRLILIQLELPERLPGKYLKDEFVISLIRLVQLRLKTNQGD
jgi:hypothetical protein